MLIATASAGVAAVSRSGRAVSTSTVNRGVLRAVWVASSKSSRAATVANVGSSRMPPSRWANRFDLATGVHAAVSHRSATPSGTGPA